MYGMKFTDERLFEKFRMDSDAFTELANSLSHRLERRDTKFRQAIPLGKRVAVALFVLKGGCDFGVVADLFGLGRSTVGFLLREFCVAVIEEMSQLIHFPDSEQEKAEIAQNFFNKWQFYDCFGSIDGVHIPILPPQDNAPDYYCYKSFHSINVLAMSDDKYFHR